MSNAINDTMREAVVTGVFPAAELLVARDGEILFHDYYGTAREGMCFDIASLTKPVSTAALAMMLVGEGLLKLDDTIYQWLPGARQPFHRQITVEHLLRHTSGLPAWQPYYRELPLGMVGTEAGKRFLLEACFQEEPIAKPGEREIYSDIGYIMLGEIIAHAGDAPLAALFSQKISTPLNMTSTFFVQNVGVVLSHTQRHTDTTPDQHVPVPKPEVKTSKRKLTGNEYRRFAPTEDCPWRERIIHGEVHDQNAYALGGVAGHAGLFSVASDLSLFSSEIYRAYHGKSEWLPREVVGRFIDAKLPNFEYVLGWDTPSKVSSSAGSHFSENSIGHLGYTGCSMWIDLEKAVWIILLTNRIHPSATNEKIRSFRPQIHNIVFEEIIK